MAPRHAQIVPDRTLEQMIELRCRREILQRWLASEVLPDNLQQGLRAMLGEVEQQMQAVYGRLD
jgi:hypothetical protein